MDIKDADLTARVEAFARRLEEAAATCAATGHTDVIWHDYSVSNRSNPLYDTVTGMCNSCLAGVERPLNDKERAAINDFYHMCQQPMDL